VFYGSMALANGWHRSTHAGALAISAFSYRYARVHAHDPRFTFGTGKPGELAGYSSALILFMIVLIIGYESAVRLLNPVAPAFEAIAIAVVGLRVNLVSAWLLRDGHHHSHHHGHHHDHNIRSAYLTCSQMR
jgi:cation diffusion facilitator family transporter